MENKAWNRVLAGDSSFGEKAAAWLTTNAVKLKEAIGGGLPQAEGGVIPFLKRRNKKKKGKKRKKKKKKTLRKKKTTTRRRRKSSNKIRRKKRKKQRSAISRGRGMVIMKKVRGNGLKRGGGGNGLMDAFLKASLVKKKRRK